MLGFKAPTTARTTVRAVGGVGGAGCKHQAALARESEAPKCPLVRESRARYETGQVEGSQSCWKHL